MSTKKEKYLQLKHDRLNNCGQCIGFRAKGIDLSANEEKPACVPAVDCHKSCPALGLGGKPTPPRIKSTAQQQVSAKTGPSERTYEVQVCYRCACTEEQFTLLPCRHKGQSLWVCTRCLPGLIHG